MLFQEKTMKSEKIYEGKILNLRVDTVELPDKKYSKREIIEHPGAVAIIPLTRENNIVLVKQYRKAVERFLLEVPAGKLEVNEEPRETAYRELMEETGYKAEKVEYMMEVYPSPGFSDEKIYIFKATGLNPGEVSLDDGEFLEVEELSFEEVERKINRGEILDAKTIIAFNLVKGMDI